VGATPVVVTDLAQEGQALAGGHVAAEAAAQHAA
jgi:hypothetical protein